MDTQLRYRTIGSCDVEIPAPCCIVIFGASGDLFKRRLMPALYRLHKNRLLPDLEAVSHKAVIEHLLAKVQVPDENIHRINGEYGPIKGAAEYEEEIWGFFEISDD